MLTEKNLKNVEQVLLRERERVREAMQGVEAEGRGLNDTGDLTHYPLHPADEGTDTQEKEKAFLLAEQEGNRLYQIDDALRRLHEDPESFGTCGRCGEEIQAARLEVIPESAYCAACQRALEDGGQVPPTTGRAI